MMKSFEKFNEDVEKKSLEKKQEEKKLTDVKEKAEKFEHDVNNSIEGLNNILGGKETADELKLDLIEKKQKFDREMETIVNLIEHKKQELISLKKEGEKALDDYEKKHQHMKNIYRELGQNSTKVDQKFNESKNTIRESLKKIDENIYRC